MKPLVEALARRPLDVPPVWIMRQAGRHLPEYRELRNRVGFEEAVSTPAIAAEITLQPVRRYGMDGAVIFADIMTPLQAMGVDVTFDPGPRLRPRSVREVVELGKLDPERVGFVAETIRRVSAELPDGCAVIGFCGGPVTLLAYLLEGGSSRDFLSLRRALLAEPEAAAEALAVLATAMNRYLSLQAEAGADVVQVFDTWAGVLDRDRIARFALPSARRLLEGLAVPTIYFAPGASFALDLLPEAGADCYGLDWRVPIDRAWQLLGDVAVQGNLDPAVLLASPPVIEAAVEDLLARTEGKPGHVVNLGHGIDRATPPGHVTALVEAVRRR